MSVVTTNQRRGDAGVGVLAPPPLSPASVNTSQVSGDLSRNLAADEPQFSDHWIIPVTHLIP